MYEVLLLNFKNIGLAMILFSIAYISNMSFSMFYNIKINKENFEYSKLLNSLFKVLSLCIGTFLLTVIITFLPIYLQNMGIPLTEEFSNTINIVAIIAIFINPVYKYSRESFETLKNILNYDDGSDI